MKKQPTGFGMFVRRDVNGNPCCIGDRVKITAPRQIHSFPDEDGIDEEQVYEERSDTGVLCLWWSRGLMLKLENGIYKKIKTNTRSPIVERIWELI
jgi:hypothetical protein